MAVIVNMHQAKTELSRLVGQALAGEEVIIARAGTPVVRLTPIQRERVPGLARGAVSIGADFDEPLPEDVIAGFEGR